VAKFFKLADMEEEKFFINAIDPAAWVAPIKGLRDPLRHWERRHPKNEIDKISLLALPEDNPDRFYDA
jgi:hypothetical protein